MLRLRPVLALGVAVTLAMPSPAQAFSTRIHIMIANKVREALVASGDGTIALRMGDFAVKLSPADVEALSDYPLAFRAGAVGPDNMVFPGMTDPSHALGQRPFEQCELLYQAAVVAEERAYALGCFLHGSTDAVAHHYVNYMTGETFTLTPITSGRAQSQDNVVRHILAESQLQAAAVEQDPEAFAGSKLLHTIPIGFVLRAYLDQDSELWKMMAAHGKAEYDKVRAANPGAALPAIVAAMEVGPADHLVLSPVYLASVDDSIVQARLDLEVRIADMQDPGTPEGAELLVTAGKDGELGTKDDTHRLHPHLPAALRRPTSPTSACSRRATTRRTRRCPPPSRRSRRSSAQGALRLFPRGVHAGGRQELSAKLNEAPDAMDGAFGVSKDGAQAEHCSRRSTTGPTRLSTIDYDTLVYATIPDWIIELDTLPAGARPRRRPRRDHEGRSSTR
jgi:hypothetical protein